MILIIRIGLSAWTPNVNLARKFAEFLIIIIIIIKSKISQMI